jgi:hypothetical protein
MHHHDDVHANVGRPAGHPGLFPSSVQLTLPLDAADWEIVVASAFERSATNLDGQPTTVKDTVLRAAAGLGPGCGARGAVARPGAGRGRGRGM